MRMRETEISIVGWAHVTFGRATANADSEGLVWAAGFEPTARAFQVRYSTKLSYAQAQTSDRVITRVAVEDVAGQERT